MWLRNGHKFRPLRSSMYMNFKASQGFYFNFGSIQFIKIRVLIKKCQNDSYLFKKMSYFQSNKGFITMTFADLLQFKNKKGPTPQKL